MKPNRKRRKEKLIYVALVIVIIGSIVLEKIEETAGHQEHDKEAEGKSAEKEHEFLFEARNLNVQIPFKVVLVGFDEAPFKIDPVQMQSNLARYLTTVSPFSEFSGSSSPLHFDYSFSWHVYSYSHL